MSTLLLLTLTSALAQDPAYDRAASTAEEAEKPVTKLTASLGGNFVWGNAFVVAANGGIDGSHTWQANRFGWNAGVNLMLQKVDTDGDGTVADPEDRGQKLQYSSEQFNGLLRYDRFFGKEKLNSFYVSAAGERNRLAGLLWRFNQQVGYRRVLVGTDATSLDLEVGIAVTEENFATGVDDNGDPINDQVLDAVYPAARLFLGFSHNFNEHVSIGDSVEAFENLLTPADFRLNNTLWLSAKLNSILSLKLSYGLAFDNLPPSEEYSKLDMSTQLALVAAIF